MRIRWKALIPVLGIIGAWLASPEALALVPDKSSHVLLALSSLIAVLTPALLTNRPKAEQRARTERRKIEERLNAAGLRWRETPAPLAPNSPELPPPDLEVPPLKRIPAKERGDGL
jgi:hypothetical protein